MFAVVTTILVVGAVYFARPILAPVTFALFIIAIVWPLQRSLQARMPKELALAFTVLVTLMTLAGLAVLTAWAFTKTGHWLVGNATRLQSLYAQGGNWLQGHGVDVAGLWVDFFNPGRLIRAVNTVMNSLQGLLAFTILTGVFVLLGVLEVEPAARKLQARRPNPAGPDAAAVVARIASKLQTWMLVRTAMSIVTGLAVWGFALIAGLELAVAWGIIAFVLNYIPFLGPLIATMFPTLFAVVQTESWQLPVLVFLSLNVIQFMSGSYIEPRIAGSALSLSPFMVLFAVFFGSFLWGIPGAFLGIPILIALVTVCAAFPSMSWVADLLSGDAKTEDRNA